MITLKEIAPYVITATVIICAVIAVKVKKEDVLTIDGIFAVAGFVLGLFITSLNLIYSNNYLISLGPLLAIACLLYLRFRTKILTSRTDFNLNFSSKTLKVINILYWLCISISLISYHQAPPYYRPPIFFVTITLGATLLGLEILGSKFNNNYNVFSIISKILLISLILRASAYFISPYPIGTDPWEHAEYIKYFLQFHHVTVPQDWNVYYCNYPLAHLLACVSNLIGNISIKESMFIIGAVLALSTIFVYLIVKKITNNINLALLSMLLLNFADFHIQWSVTVLAMTFGIAIYAIIIYLILKAKEKQQILYSALLILFLFVIVWTHTVSGFIALVSVISLYVGSFVYHAIYRDDKHKGLVVSLTLCMIFTVILVFRWMDPNYPFYAMIIEGLVNSLNAEAEFLGRVPSITQQNWESLLTILGFLVYIFFGIIGSLYSLSKKYEDKTKVSLVFMLIVLFFVFFAFPIFGIRNIMPYRWPAFIYVSFVLFVCIGFTGFSSMLKSKHQKIAFVFILLLITSFFMTTNFVTNMDSPIYGGEIVQRRIATESEMALSENVGKFYNGTIMRYYALTPAGDISWSYMTNKLFIWKKIGLTRPVRVKILMDIGSRSWPNMLLGEEYKTHLDGNCSCIYDTGGARAYLGKS
jgi:hypothetical protein